MTRRAMLSAAVWTDPDWRGLSVDAQHLYVLLLSQPQITLCGVQPLMVAKWATLAKGWTAKAVETALGELETARFVVVDHDTFEVMIRSFMRHDGVMDSPNFAKGALARAVEVASPAIQWELVEELSKCEPKARKAEVLQDVLRRLDETIAFLSATAKPQEAVKPVTEPESSQPKPRSTNRGTRLQEGWQPDDATIAKACADFGLSRQQAWDEHQAFENYWLSKPGKDAAKLDWNRTWLNWMKRFAERMPANSSAGMSAREQRIIDAERLKVHDGGADAAELFQAIGG